MRIFYRSEEVFYSITSRSGMFLLIDVKCNVQCTFIKKQDFLLYRFYGTSFGTPFVIFVEFIDYDNDDVKR